ncbi:MAG: hypothetical protein ACRELC_12115, partial [Gemmatimonadota bacterium]
PPPAGPRFRLVERRSTDEEGVAPTAVRTLSTAGDPADRLDVAATGASGVVAGGELQEAPRCTDPSRSRSMSRQALSSEEGTRWSVTIRGDDGCLFELELDGELRFDATFSSIAWIEPGARFQIRSEEPGEPDRRLDVRGDEAGRPAIRFWREGDEVALDDEARAWLAGALLPVLRLTGIAAEERTRWLLGRGGPTAVFREVELIGSDHVQKRYLLALVDEGELDEEGLSRVLRVATETIGSDGTMSDLVVELVARRPEVLRGGGLPAFEQAVAGVSSDSEHRAMLLRLLDLQGGDPAVRGTLLASARDHIGSDSETRHFLAALAERYPTELGEARYWAAAATIGSDSELRTVLLALADSDLHGGRALAPALEAASVHIGSDSEMRTFLERLVRGRPSVASGAPADAFWRCIDTIDSDSELSRALLALIEETGEGEALAGALAAAARGLGSDSEMSSFLVAFANRHRSAATGRLRDAYLEAVHTIGSDSERERALAALER